MAAQLRYVFKKYPIVPNALVYGSMVVGAEFCQQTLNKRYFHKKDPPEPYDFGSLARSAIVGTLINPNILYFWFQWIESHFPGTSFPVSMKKLALHALIPTPALTAIFYVSMSWMEGKEDVFEECRQKFLPTFQTSCMFWLPAQLINFMIVPPVLRVFYAGTCSFIWINLFCWIKRNSYVLTEDPILIL